MSKKVPQINLFFKSLLRYNNAGRKNKEIQIILKLQVPIIEIILIKFGKFVKLNAIKFQGKPVKICPLKNSKILNNETNKKKELEIFLRFIFKKRREINP